MKVAVTTGSRAEYGLLKPLIQAIKKGSDWELLILATGAHLSPEFGLTYKQIEEDGFPIDKKIEMLLSADSPTAIVKSIGLGMMGFADALQELSPDILVILGDRYEMLAVASAALILRIPIAHIHGGEITEGAYDDAIRHAITKMSYLHFASTEDYRQRIIQMGEAPDRVFNVGAIGLDNIRQMKLMSHSKLEQELGIQFRKYNYLVAFHPATLDNQPSQEQFQVLLESIKEQEDAFFIFTKSNADTNGRIINQMMDEFARQNPRKAKAFTSLGTLRFLSLVANCTAIVGNSSSGIIESPSLKTATINIGERQKGRIQAKSVINTIVNKEAINKSFIKSKEDSFQNQVRNVINPYGNGHASTKIMNVLREMNLKQLKTKTFFDVKFKV